MKLNCDIKEIKKQLVVVFDTRQIKREIEGVFGWRKKFGIFFLFSWVLKFLGVAWK